MDVVHQVSNEANQTNFPQGSRDSTNLERIACRTGVIFCVNRGESEANARRARSASGAREEGR